MWQVQVRVFTFWVLSSGASAAVAQTAEAPAVPDQLVAHALSVYPGPTCLEEDRLESRLVRWLERERIDSDIRIQVQGGPGQSDFKFTLWRADAEPTVRELPAVPGDCGDQHAAVALAIALAIDASLLGPLTAPEQTTVVAPVAMLPMPQQQPHSPRLSLSMGGGVGVGFVTDVAPGAFAALHAEVLRSLEVRLAGRWTGLFGAQWPGLNVKYDVGLTTAGLGMCPVVRPLSFLVATLCGEFLGGVFRTRAEGLHNASIENLPYWAVGAGLDFRVFASDRIGFRISIDLVLPLISRRLAIDDPTGKVSDERELLPTSVFLGAAPLVVLF